MTSEISAPTNAFNGTDELKQKALRTSKAFTSSFDFIAYLIVGAEKLGFPLSMVHVVSQIINELSDGRQKGFARQLFESIRPGSDLSGVARELNAWLLVGYEHAVINYVLTEEERQLVLCAAESLRGNPLDGQALEAARKSAEDFCADDPDRAPGVYLASLACEDDSGLNGLAVLGAIEAIAGALSAGPEQKVQNESKERVAQDIGDRLLIILKAL